MNQSLEDTRTEASNTLFAMIGRCTSRLARAIGEARGRAALRAEFARLRDDGQLDQVLKDLGIEAAELSTLFRNHPGAPRRLATMLWHLRIEATKKGRKSWEMRAIERTCSLCETSGKCDRWLAFGRSEDPNQFCPNAEAFRELVASGKAKYLQGA